MAFFYRAEMIPTQKDYLSGIIIKTGALVSHPSKWLLSFSHIRILSMCPVGQVTTKKNHRFMTLKEAKYTADVTIRKPDFFCLFWSKEESKTIAGIQSQTMPHLGLKELKTNNK